MDKRIKGLILQISYIRSGFAKMAEIGSLLQSFKKSGKPVIAFIETGGLKEYFVATFADNIHLFRGGLLSLRGIAAEAMFLKRTLSKLGIKAEIFHIGEYKTGYNMFTEERLTPSHRESLESLVHDIYGTVVSVISERRGLDKNFVKEILEESPLENEKYLEARFIDSISFKDEAMAKFKKYPVVDFDKYRKTSSPRAFSGEKAIAVIFAQGEIHSGYSGGKSVFGDVILGSETLAGQLKHAREAPSVRAAVLRINSPGGSAIASDRVLREAELLAKKKPLIISMSDVAASGAYWLSLSGSKIFAHPQTVTGSIGVIGGKFILRKLYNDILGVNKEIIQTTKYAAMYSDYREFTPEERQKVLGMMQHVYNSFLQKVVRFRKMKISVVKKIARGRVWSGSMAKERGLIDEIGGLHDAIEKAKQMAKIPKTERISVRIYPKRRSLLDLLVQLGSTQTDPLVNLKKSLLRYTTFFPAFLMPFSVVFY